MAICQEKITGYLFVTESYKSCKENNEIMFGIKLSFNIKKLTEPLNSGKEL